jgi:hypothetical protein
VEQWYGLKYKPVQLPLSLNGFVLLDDWAWIVRILTKITLENNYERMQSFFPNLQLLAFEAKRPNPRPVMDQSSH